MEATFFRLIQHRKGSLAVYGLLFALIFIVYLYQSVIPAFNSDDIRFGFPFRGFFGFGRWGTTIVYHWQNYNPIPGFSSFVACCLYFASYFTALHLFRFEYAASKLVFISLSVISFFYGELMEFDHFHIPYALADFLAVYGLLCILQRRRFLGVVLFSLSPAFYTPGVELAAGLLVATTIKRLIDEPSYKSIKDFAITTFYLAIAMGIFMLITHVINRSIGLEGARRLLIDPLAIVNRFDEIERIFRDFAFPIWPTTNPIDWEPAMAKYPALAIYLLFCILSCYAALKRGGARKAILVGLLDFILLLTPFILLFAQQRDYTFGTRALYGFSMVRGFAAAFFLEQSIPQFRSSLLSRLGIYGVLSLGLIILGSTAIEIGKEQFIDHLETSKKFTKINGVLARIEDVLGEAQYPPSDQIPLLIIDSPFSSRFIGSPELEFIITDRRFFEFRRSGDPKTTFERWKRYVEEGRQHNEWPANDSIYVKEGVVIVLMRR